MAPASASVAPGWIETDMTANLIANEKFHDNVLKRVPMRRWGIPKDVADACVYLASQEAGFVTGQTICVNGGMTQSEIADLAMGVIRARAGEWNIDPQKVGMLGFSAGGHVDWIT